MSKYGVCQYRYRKGFNLMKIAINSNSRRDTLAKGLVCRWIKYLNEGRDVKLGVWQYIETKHSQNLIERGCNTSIIKRTLVKDKALHCEGIKLNVRV